MNDKMINTVFFSVATLLGLLVLIKARVLAQLPVFNHRGRVFTERQLFWWRCLGALMLLASGVSLIRTWL
jgi:hypothetical protein